MRHIKDFASSPGSEGIGTQHEHSLVGERVVQALFVLQEVLPIFVRQPRFVAMDSHSRITSGQGLLELQLPVIDDPRAIEAAALKIPLIMRDDFDAPSRYV